MLTIHYDPGARGDFLASILFSTIPKVNKQERVIINFKNYKKIHTATDYAFLNEDGIKIKIAHNNNLDNLLQIAHFHHTKNVRFLQKAVADDLGTYEKIYLFIKYIAEQEKIALNYKLQYNYWIAFENIHDIGYLENLYSTIHHSSMTNKLKKAAVENIQNQTIWTNRNDLLQYKNLADIINFEIANDLLSTKRIPDQLIDSLVNNKNIDLTIEQYTEELK
jgi:hypothetical protein